MGAAEILAAVLSESPATDGGSTRVGSVLEVYDRSAYLRFDEGVTTGVPFAGPRLVLLGPPTVAGPLTIELEALTGRGVDLSSLEPGASCRLHRSTVEERERYVLSVGAAFDIVFEAPTPTLDTSAVGVHDRTAIRAGTPVYESVVETLRWVGDAGFEDGLGWIESLTRLARGDPVDEEVGAVVDAWCRYLDGETDSVPDAAIELLGRGPGATPSGDDITAGILATLVATVEGSRRDRVLSAGETIVAAADERTTTVSTALLAQASRGRVAPPMREGLAALLAPDLDVGRRRAALRAMAEHGHTSGVDVLVGMVLTVVAIGPRLA